MPRSRTMDVPSTSCAVGCRVFSIHVCRLATIAQFQHGRWLELHATCARADALEHHGSRCAALLMFDCRCDIVSAPSGATRFRQSLRAVMISASDHSSGTGGSALPAVLPASDLESGTGVVAAAVLAPALPASPLSVATAAWRGAAAHGTPWQECATMRLTEEVLPHRHRNRRRQPQRARAAAMPAARGRAWRAQPRLGCWRQLRGRRRCRAGKGRCRPVGHHGMSARPSNARDRKMVGHDSEPSRASQLFR